MKVDRLRDLVRVRLNRETITHDGAYWDARAESLDGLAASMWVNNTLNELYHREALAVVDRLIDVRGRDVLEIGCGVGRWVEELAARGARVTGVDFSEGALQLARRRCPPGPTVTYRRQSLDDIDDAGSFDVVFGWGILVIACPNRAALMGTLARLRTALRPGGEILLMEPMHAGPLSRVLKLSRDGFIAAVEEAGFTVVETDVAHFWPLLRIPLSYFDVPPAITRASFAIGRRLGAVLRHPRWWDYTVVHARRRDDGTEGSP